MLPTRTLQTASHSFWPPWCLSRQVALYHPWRSMPLTVTPTPRKLSASKPCPSWEMNPAPTVASTTSAGSRSTYTLMWTSSMTPIQRPTDRLSQRPGEASHCAFSGKRHFLTHIQMQPKRDGRVRTQKKYDHIRKKSCKGTFTEGTSSVLKQTWAEGNTWWHRALWSCRLQVCSARSYLGHCTLICSHEQHYRERRDKDTRFQFYQ